MPTSVSRTSSKVILFLGSFGALAAQLLLIKLTENLIHNETVSYTAILFVHYFSLALAAKGKIRISLAWSQSLLGVLTPVLILSVLWLPSWLILEHISAGVDAALLTSLDLTKCICLSIASASSLGILHGLELPLLTNASEDKLGESLFAAYLGALLAFILVPLFLIPKIGILATASALAFLYSLNVLLLRKQNKTYILAFSATIVTGLFTIKFIQPLDPLRRSIIYSDGISDWPEERLSSIGQIIRFISGRVQVTLIESPVQTIEWVKYMNNTSNSFRLFLNGDFQFDSNDELAYHKSFLSPLPNGLKSVLIVGAGDGLLARQLLQDMTTLSKIDWIEIDPQMIKLAKDNIELAELNKGSVVSPKVNLQIGDAFYLTKVCNQKYEAILLDLPFPSSLALSRIYSREFYSQIKRCLSDQWSQVILDAPTEAESGKILKSTLLAAGFEEVIAYGKANTYFSASPKPKTGVQQKIIENGLPIISIEDGGAVNDLTKPQLPLIF